MQKKAQIKQKADDQEETSETWQPASHQLSLKLMINVPWNLDVLA